MCFLFFKIKLENTSLEKSLDNYAREFEPYFTISASA